MGIYIVPSVSILLFACLSSSEVLCLKGGANHRFCPQDKIDVKIKICAERWDKVLIPWKELDGICMLWDGEEGFLGQAVRQI